MKELWTVVTRKGQVTVPAPIRREMDLKKGDRVAFVMEDGMVRLIRTTSVVERTAGALKSHTLPLTAEELREAAERAIAQEAVERTEG
jgi:AbrB family looped-hinge helix DNA binding protein